MTSLAGHPTYATATAPWPRNLVRLCEAQNWRCCYCGCRFGDVPNADDYPSTDHVVPLSMDGERTWENEVAACRRCNALRGATDAFEFFDTGIRNEPPAAHGGSPKPAAAKRKANTRKAQRRMRRRLVEINDQLGAGGGATLADVWPSAHARPGFTTPL
jgi:hypothetical protein